MSKIITRPGQLDFSLSESENMPLPSSVLMVKPTYFSVDYVINPHMEGNIGNVDKEEALREWESIRDTFNKLGITVHEIDGEPGLPDMVFCANQSLPYTNDKTKHVVMSIMHSAQREDEVAFIEQWYRMNGYEIHHLKPKEISDFEGMGDAIWHSGKKLIWGGYGYRSSIKAYETISDIFDVPVIALKLTKPAFYHLDTCFCSLNAESALIYPKAFTDEGLALLDQMIPNLYYANDHEAKDLFACNATCPDGKNVIIQKGCTEVNKTLNNAGFTIHEVDTAEYLKSGGSVFCMKMLVW
ncbi:MAG TPA: arginine deiminase-related protein [Balneolales bacterium]|nr:arginine deiminase-related protein [Balneolales bacterium]